MRRLLFVALALVPGVAFAGTADTWTQSTEAAPGGGFYYVSGSTGEYCNPNYACYGQYVQGNVAPPSASSSGSSSGLYTGDPAHGGTTGGSSSSGTTLAGSGAATVGLLGSTSFAGTGAAITAGAGVMLLITAAWLTYTWLTAAANGAGSDESWKGRFRKYDAAQKAERLARKREKVELWEDREAKEDMATDAMLGRRGGWD